MLWRFIQKNAKESETEEVLLNLSGLSRRDLKVLADIRFLLSKEVKELLNIISPKVISRLSKGSINEHITERGCVRGRIDWQRTIKSRAIRGNDVSTYSYSKRAQIFDLPENRLFLFLIRQINEKARKFASDNYLDLTWYAEVSQGQKWVNNVSVIAAKSVRILRNPFISKISNLNEINRKTIELTKRCRQSHYKDLAYIAERFVYCQNDPVSFLKKELDGNIFEPLNKDTLYEIAVLFKTIQTAINEGWQEKKVALIGGNSKAVSTLFKGQCELKVYFQKLPDVMARNSDYGEIMFFYGLSDRLRRPDIILELKNDQKMNYIIIEVKRSKQQQYLGDGTYKLLGYLKDFYPIKDINTELKGVLVGWSNIEPINFSDNRELLLFNWDNYAEGLSMLLSLFEIRKVNNMYT